MQLDDVMYVEEVAAALRVKRQTIFAWVSRGKFPRGRRRPGLRRSFWTRDDVQSWILDGAKPTRRNSGRPRMTKGPWTKAQA